MAKRGRTPYVMSQEHRDKIRNSNILSTLLQHIEGKREMSSTQVTAAIALLKKYLPDLSNVEVSGDAENPFNVVTTIKLAGVSSDDRND